MQPDITRLNGKAPGKHCIYEQKVVCPVSAGQAGALELGTRVGFGNTHDHWRGEIEGTPATAHAPAVAYTFSKSRGHADHSIIHETFGGFGPAAVSLLYALSKAHGSRLGADEDAAPWCARSFRSLHAMRISVALHTCSASEILTTVRADAAAACGAPSM